MGFVFAAYAHKQMLICTRTRGRQEQMDSVKYDRMKYSLLWKCLREYDAAPVSHDATASDATRQA